MSKRKSRNTASDPAHSFKKKDIAGVILTAASAILLFSLLTKGHEGYVGSLGAGLSGNLHALFGAVSYLIPVSGFWWAAAEFRHRKFTIGYSFAGGVILFILGAAVLLHMIAGIGGELGGFTAEVILKSALGPLGAYIVASAILTVALILLTDISLRSCARYAAEALSVLAGGAARTASGALKKARSPKPEIKVTAIPEKKKKIRNKKTVSPLVTRERKPGPEAAPENPAADHGESSYSIPVELLNEPRITKTDTSEEEARGNSIVEVLKNFGIDARVSGIQIGPSITRYELSLPMDIQLSKIRNLASNIAMATQAKTVRLLTPIPGKSAVGVEVPAIKQETVPIKSLIDSDDFGSFRTSVPYCLGKAVSGELKIADLAAMPHLLLAGATGSGKSVAIHTLIVSILYKSSPRDVVFVMMDPKRVELPAYNGIPHLAADVITNPAVAVKMLASVAKEMDLRYDRLAERNVANLDDYNRIPGIEKIPRMVVVIDELADLMAMAKDRVEHAIIRIAQMARAVGIHLVLATQRPSVDVITGIIKANLPARIAFNVLSGVDSRTILDMNGAEKLLGKGDMLYQSSDLPQPERIQGCFITRKEVQAVTDMLKEKFSDYEGGARIEAEEEEVSEKGAGYKDDLYPEAVKLVIRRKKASISLLQRRLGIGYNRAARIIDTMEENSIVSEEDGVRGRRVLVAEDYLESLR